MTNLRENLVWLIGSVTTAIGVAISWFVSSEIFATLIAVLVGFLASYFLQTKTQKRAWKREYSVKIAETVYGSLYRDIKSLVSSLEQKLFRYVTFEHWKNFQQDHRYFMVDEKFREKLDELLKNVSEYQSVTFRLRNNILPNILHKEAKKIFKTRPDEIVLKISYKYEGKVSHVREDEESIVEHLILKTHPQDYYLKRYPESRILTFEVLFGQVSAGSDVVNKFDKFWESCQNRMMEDKTYRFVIEENDKLLDEAMKIKEELERLIEEPWRI